MPDDAALLAAYAQRDDLKALDALVGRHAVWLMAFLRGMASSATDAEDAFQETWLRVMKAARRFQGGSVRAYLVNTARTVLVDQHRRTRRLVANLDEPLEDGEETALERVADMRPGPDVAFMSRATQDEVLQSVRTLPEGPRMVLLMRLEGELTFQEIAEQLALPLGTVLTWMHTATQRLKKELGAKA